MTPPTTTWRDVPAANLIDLLGGDEADVHPGAVWLPDWLAEQFGIPLELLPVSEIVADPDRGIGPLTVAGRTVGAVHGVIEHRLILAIGRGLGIVTVPGETPRDAESLTRALAKQIVRHLRETDTHGAQL